MVYREEPVRDNYYPVLMACGKEQESTTASNYTVSSRNNSGSGRRIYMDKIDEPSLFYTRVSSNFGMDTGWTKGTLNVFVDFKGISITGSTPENNNQSGITDCRLNWVWG